MRTFLIRIYLAALMLVTSLWPDLKGQESLPRLTPPSVVAVTDAVYPISSVVSGTVVLEVTIDEGGKVAAVRVVRGIASLTEEAERAESIALAAKTNN